MYITAEVTAVSVWYKKNPCVGGISPSHIATQKDSAYKE